MAMISDYVKHDVQEILKSLGQRWISTSGGPTRIVRDILAATRPVTVGPAPSRASGLRIAAPHLVCAGVARAKFIDPGRVDTNFWCSHGLGGAGRDGTALRSGVQGGGDPAGGGALS